MSPAKFNGLPHLETMVHANLEGHGARTRLSGCVDVAACGTVVAGTRKRRVQSSAIGHGVDISDRDPSGIRIRNKLSVLVNICRYDVTGCGQTHTSAQADLTFPSLTIKRLRA